jgi:signal transduction histidine kinase
MTINMEGARQREEEANVASVRKRARGTAAGFAPVAIDSRFTSLLVHDLRTPLNVIGLSLRLIEQALPTDDPDVAEDLRFIEENFHVLERMLAQLGDYARLFEPGLTLAPSEFSPWRLVDELLENRSSRYAVKLAPVQLDVQKTCPAVVLLDQGRARLAFDHALANASAAAGAEPIRLSLRGAPERWIIEISIDRPPPYSVQSVELRPNAFERLCGSAAERQGMDLALVARVSELFGGSARLEAVEGRSTSIILDWPARTAVPSSSA